MTACLRFPLPSVASACLSSSYWWEPSGMFFFGLKVLDERLPLQTREHRTKQPCVNVSWLYKCPQGVETSLRILFNISLSSLLLTSSVALQFTPRLIFVLGETLPGNLWAVAGKTLKEMSQEAFWWAPYQFSVSYSYFAIQSHTILHKLILKSLFLQVVRHFQIIVEMWYKCLNLKYFKLYIVLWILWHKLFLLI